MSCAAASPDTPLRASVYQVLEYAIVVSWEELMHAAKSGVVHLEYQTSSARCLEALHIWSSRSRGYWNRVCEYSMHGSTSHPQGLHFYSGYHSDQLARLLPWVMQHQEEFSNGSGPCCGGLLQIATPSEQETEIAVRCIREVLEDAGPEATAELERGELR